jgi:endo-1,4-beta-xylanase
MPRLFLAPLLLLGLLVLVNCVPKDAPTADGPLKAAAPFPVGAALNPNLLRQNATYRTVAQGEFSGVTSENHLKPGVLVRADGSYAWENADYLVQFAQENGQRFHGHTLCWYQQAPTAYLRTLGGDSAKLEAFLKAHVTTVMQRYRGKIKSWDVLNEYFADRTGQIRRSSGGSDSSTHFHWVRYLGPDFVARLFRYARQADPDALLFYNDYSQETDEKKLAAILAMAADFKRRGVPLDGLGLQMHISINTPNAGIENAIRQCAATGLKIHISELDVKVNPSRQSPFTLTDDLARQQADKVRFVVQTYRRLVPPAQQWGITQWNVGDADSWIPKWEKADDFPTLFDTQYGKKKAYFAFLEALKQ